MPIQTVQAAGAGVRVRTGSGGGAPHEGRPILMALDPPNVLEHYAQPFVAFAQRRARLVAFEPPGFGRSTAPRGYAHTPDDAADVVVALIERLGLDRPVLAFPCLMAYAALRVAQKRPDLVSGLVLSQAPSFEEETAWARRVDKQGILRTPVLGQAALLFKGDPLVQRWYETAVADPERARHMSALAIEMLDHGAKFPLATAFQALFRGDAPPVPTRVRVPTLAVWGAADRSHRKSDPTTIRRHAPDAEILVMEDVGHFPELEAPPRFCDAVLAWMARAGLP